MLRADYYTITLSDLTPIEAELAAAIAFDAGASGTAEELAFEQKSRIYEPVTLEKERTQLVVYFEQLPPQGLVEELQAKFPQAQIQLASEANKDWLAEWKKGFQPFCLCPGTWIVPSWCETPKEAKNIIRIDPGMAFGTGTHETTKLAAGFINDYAPPFLKNSPQASLIDVGTGTGILAILAEQLGFDRVLGNDIDVEARRVARENLQLNSVKKTQIVDLDIDKINDSADWVVANIIDGVLVQLRPHLISRVKERGHLLLTGILNERDELFCAEFSFEGFKVRERRELGEWVGYLLQRN